MRASIWKIAIVPVLLYSATEGGKQPVTMTDLLKIRNVTDVEVARDGSFAVYAVRSIHTAMKNGEPEYSYRSNLWFIDLNDAQAKPLQLTFGVRTDGAFAISPDGRQLAFVRRDDAAAERPRQQVWLLPLQSPGEPKPVTSLENGAGNPVWRPDGKALLVSSAIPISKIEGKPHYDLERPGREWFDYDRVKPGEKDAKVEARPDGDRQAIRNWLEKNASKDNPTVINRINFIGEQALTPEPTVATLFLIELAEGNKATQLSRDFYSRGAFSFSPDGKQIVYNSTPPVSTHPDRLRRASVWMMNADGSGARTVLDNEAWSYFQPRFSPDGASLYFTASESDQPGFRQAKLGRMNLASKEIAWLAADWKSAVGQYQLGSDGTVRFTSNWQGGEPLLAIENGRTATLTPAQTGVAAFDEGGGKVVAALISVPNPNELYLIGKDGKTRQLTELNSGWLANKLISLPEERWITRPDGVRVQYWVMNPVNSQPGKKYPWVLDMHGGPSAMWGPGEFSMWHEFQLFCAWGYGVVYANPRGSSGYGYEFQRANYKNWGEGPAGDVLAALDEAISRNAMIDRDRLFLTGGSYAGYLTAWIIGHDQRFKAAAAQRGVYELSTFFGEANAFRLVENHFGGFPWEAESRKLLDQQSPFTYVDQIRTPFLILHGSQDFRTGVAQSEMIYKALKQLGRPVEYVRYPNIGHEQTRSGPPLARMDHMMRIVEFFERYSKNDRPAPVETK